MLHVGALDIVACGAGLHEASFSADAGLAIKLKRLKMQAKRIFLVICVSSRTGFLRRMEVM